jgi:hypothetical protein
MRLDDERPAWKSVKEELKIVFGASSLLVDDVRQSQVDRNLCVLIRRRLSRN